MTFGRDRDSSSAPSATEQARRWDAPYAGPVADGFGGYGQTAPSTMNLQLRADDAASTPTDPARALDVAAQATSGPGTPLPHEAAIQRAFGPHDVSGIRAHMDGAAGDGARQLGAQAFATGNDVAFAAPSPDLHTAAHEAAHVVQQRAGVHLKGGVGESGDAYERQADAVADLVVRGESAADLLGPTQGSTPPHAAAVQRFDGDEHKKLGDDVRGAEPVAELSSKELPVTYGDLVMLAGDLYGSIEDIRKLASTRTGREELRYALWFARESKTRGPEPRVSAEVKQRVQERYDLLSADNRSHFSEGGTAEPTYQGHHLRALEQAYLAGKFNDDAMFAKAVTDEAFAQHFLSDMFSAGHVRTPRAKWEQDDADAPIPSNLKIVQYLAYRIYAQLDAMGDFGVVTAVPGVPMYIWGEKIEPVLKEQAGTAIEAVSASDLLAKVQHDRDGKGLNVTSDRDAGGHATRGGAPWRAVGDSRMVDNYQVTGEGRQTYDMALAAMRESRAALDRMRALGAGEDGQPSFDPRRQPVAVDAFRALDFVPHQGQGNEPVGAGSGAPEDLERWHTAIDEVFRRAVVPRLRRIYPPDATISQAGYTLHVGKAVQAVADEMAHSPHAWLDRAMEWDYVPFGDAPVPAGVPAAGPPVDAGVDSP